MSEWASEDDLLAALVRQVSLPPRHSWYVRREPGGPWQTLTPRQYRVEAEYKVFIVRWDEDKWEELTAAP